MNWPLACILWATTCVACAHPRLVPYVSRPDTRMVWGVTVDTAAFRQTIQAFQDAHPNESAVCYHGVVRDTLFQVSNGTAKALLLWLQTVTPAQQDSADKFNVYGPRCPEETIGIGHSHPHAGNWCDHSDTDVRLLFSQRYALVSIIWCLNGESQVLYQDGRRTTIRWRDP